MVGFPGRKEMPSWRIILEEDQGPAAWLAERGESSTMTVPAEKPTPSKATHPLVYVHQCSLFISLGHMLSSQVHQHVVHMV